MGGGGSAPPEPFQFGDRLGYQYAAGSDPWMRLSRLEAEVAALHAQLASRDDFTRWLDKALAYQTAVMAIAYAGFFILWEKVEGVGHDRLHAIAGILMGLSLAVYIIWTLLQMNAVHERLLGKDPGPSMRRLEGAGPDVFKFSVCTGLGAAAVVMGIWFFRLLR